MQDLENIYERLCLFKGQFYVPVLVVVFVAFVLTSTSEARSLANLRVDFQAELFPNGSMMVKENRTMKFVGPYKGADGKLVYNHLFDYKEIVVRDDEQIYWFVEEYPTSVSNIFTLAFSVQIMEPIN